MAEEITINPTDLESLAEAVGLGITTPEQLADWIGVDLIEDCLVLEDSPWYADDGNAEVEYEDAESAKDAAEQYVEGGDWGSENSTSWVKVYAYKKGANDKGEIVQVRRESHKIEIEPTEPDCVDDHDHLWKSPYSLLGGLEENPGVWGNAGGIITKEVCMKCGCLKTTDTWAQDMTDGEQGLTSIEYTEGEFADEIAKLHIKRAVEKLDAKKGGEIPYDYIYTINGESRGVNDSELEEYGLQLLDDEDAEPEEGFGFELDDSDLELVDE